MVQKGVPIGGRPNLTTLAGRVTWSIHETERRPAIEINDCPPRQLVKTPTPWPVSYDCRIQVSVRSLAIDIVWSIEGYLQDLQSNPKARANFETCMKDYFPLDPPNECPQV